MIILRIALALVAAFNASFLASGLHAGVPRTAKAPHAVAGRGPRESHGTTKVYIVFTARQAAAPDMTPEPETNGKIEAFHHGLLDDAIRLDGNSSARERVVYHYTRSLHGFAARLTEQEKNNLAGRDGVLSIHERVVYRPQTTRSWDFLGVPLQEHRRRGLPFEQDVIIGVLDTGVSPDSESFSDDGLAPPPAKWKGRCSEGFECNNKIIGAWAYDGGLPDGQVTPEDDDGHGTHAASTAAGREVRSASLYGVANGTARGGVPGARLAIYKVCWYDSGCGSEDVLAAMDDAAADGVDVILAPLSAEAASEHHADALAIGAFHALRRGALTSVPAGNCGPKLGTLSNVAPWMVSAGGTTTDRRIVAAVVLGNSKRFLGNSINTFPDIGKRRSLLVDPGNCDDKLEGVRYKGAILLCPPQGFISQQMIARSGAVGIILPDDDDDETSSSSSVPVVMARPAQFQEILRYYNESRHPTATIFNSQTTFDASAPVVASFSSRGPNLVTPGVLKPTGGSMADDLNYPSIAIPVVNYGVGFAVEVPRTVTNVGPGESVYRVEIGTAPAGITITVAPDKLAFTAEQHKLRFKVSVVGSLQAPQVVDDGGNLGASASIVWSDGKHEVRSPIYIFPTQFRSYIEPVECRCKPEKCDSQLGY
ncbi:unnamed protein product [Urochloa decumbens]|uniref:Uncharacterized protein n=1 Tax=Urochloa decumbens TaxID=240449 RepID=A0ABC9F0S1_9POAL